jgi:hypothetical protein
MENAAIHELVHAISLCSDPDSSYYKSVSGLPDFTSSLIMEQYFPSYVKTKFYQKEFVNKGRSDNYSSVVYERMNTGFKNPFDNILQKTPDTNVYNSPFVDVYLAHASYSKNISKFFNIKEAADAKILPYERVVRLTPSKNYAYEKSGYTVQEWFDSSNWVNGDQSIHAWGKSLNNNKYYIKLTKDNSRLYGIDGLTLGFLSNPTEKNRKFTGDTYGLVGFDPDWTPKGWACYSYVSNTGIKDYYRTVSYTIKFQIP